MSEPRGKPLETFFEVVIPIGKDEKIALLCKEQLLSHMNLIAEVREVAK